MADPRRGATQAEPERVPERMSIAERAARRDQLVADRDRYSSLVRVLRAGREIPLKPRRRRGLRVFDDLAWNPIATRLVILVAIVVIAALGAKLAGDWFRQGSVDTWTGPDATVTSGQRLDACPEVTSLAAVETYPNWVRYGGNLYVRTDTIRPGLIDGVSYLDSGYRLDHLLLVLLQNTPEGRARQEIMIWSDGAMAGAVYRDAAGC